MTKKVKRLVLAPAILLDGRPLPPMTLTLGHWGKTDPAWRTETPVCGR